MADGLTSAPSFTLKLPSNTTSLKPVQHTLPCHYNASVIHFFFFISGLRSWGQQPQQRCPDLHHLHHVLRGNTKAFPGQPRDIIAPASSGSAPRPPSVGTCQINLPRDASEGYPNQVPKPPQLVPFDVKEQQVYSKSSQMSELVTLSLRESPANLQRKIISASCNHDLVLSVTTHSL